MDYIKLVEKIYPEGADFNLACFGFSEAEAREKLLWRDAKPMPTQEELDAAQVSANKEEQIALKYEQMKEEIYTRMEATFGTSSDVSVAANASTWEAMLKRPTNYVDTEMNLNTEQEVLDHATIQLANADAFGLYRLKRIKQFKDEKETILNA